MLKGSASLSLCKDTGSDYSWFLYYYIGDRTKPLCLLYLIYCWMANVVTSWWKWKGSIFSSIMGGIKTGKDWQINIQSFKMCSWKTDAINYVLATHILHIISETGTDFLYHMNRSDQAWFQEATLRAGQLSRASDQIRQQTANGASFE